MITTHKNITLCVRLNVKKDRYKYMLILRTLNLSSTRPSTKMVRRPPHTD